MLILNADQPLTNLSQAHSCHDGNGPCLTVKRRQGSCHEANSCIKVCFPLAWAIYFRLLSNPYMLSEFTVENRNMANRFLVRGRDEAGQKTWKNARQTFVSYTLYGGSIVKERD